MDIEYVKCTRCKKIGNRASYTRVNGYWYGPECKKIVLANAGESLEEYIERLWGINE